MLLRAHYTSDNLAPHSIPITTFEMGITTFAIFFFYYYYFCYLVGEMTLGFGEVKNQTVCFQGPSAQTLCSPTF